MAAQRTFDRSKVWDSPDPTVDLKSLHLKENIYPLESLNIQESQLVCYLKPNMVNSIDTAKIKSIFQKGARLYVDPTGTDLKERNLLNDSQNFSEDDDDAEMFLSGS